jgi:hypothetical protein
MILELDEIFIRVRKLIIMNYNVLIAKETELKYQDCDLEHMKKDIAVEKRLLLKITNQVDEMKEKYRIGKGESK